MPSTEPVDRLAHNIYAGVPPRRGGRSALSHPYDVMTRFNQRYFDKISQKELSIGLDACWLHDVVEDNLCSAEELARHGVRPSVIQLVSVLLNHNKSVPYAIYIETLANDPLARKIKICDILTNLGDRPTDVQIRKYASALNVLLDHDHEDQDNAKPDCR